MEAERLLQKDLEELQKAVKKLGGRINQSGLNWKDEKFTQLTVGVNDIARSSKQVLAAGSRCQSALRRFHSIESE